jgi:hypothetical protein
MTGKTGDTPFKKESFEIHNLRDEIRADKLCTRFLKLFYLDLVGQEKLSPEEASALAYGADYFLREFVISDRRDNIFTLSSRRIRQFAANWYIVKNLEPNMGDLAGILKGIQAFYKYCHRAGKVSAEFLINVQKECSELDYYRQRIEAFWAIENNGYLTWEQECTLKD